MWLQPHLQGRNPNVYIIYLDRYYSRYTSTKTQTLVTSTNTWISTHSNNMALGLDFRQYTVCVHLLSKRGGGRGSIEGQLENNWQLSLMARTFQTAALCHVLPPVDGHMKTHWTHSWRTTAGSSLHLLKVTNTDSSIWYFPSVFWVLYRVGSSRKCGNNNITKGKCPK